MNFTVYDLLSNIIPGLIIYSILMKTIPICFDTIPDFVVLALSYVIGYLNNGLSSWSENLLHITWGGKPSDKILDGKQIWKVHFYEYDEVKKLLNKETKHGNPSNDELFKIAQRIVYSQGIQITKELHQSYIFSRSIFVCFFIVTFFINFKYWFDYQVLIGSLFILFVTWLRSKQRAYYYARQVLNSYLSIRKETKEE